MQGEALLGARMHVQSSGQHMHVLAFDAIVPADNSRWLPIVTSTAHNYKLMNAIMNTIKTTAG